MRKMMTAADCVVTMANIWLLSGVLIGALINCVESGIGVGAAGDPQVPGNPSTGTEHPEEDDFALDLYGLPGFQHEFKIEVNAGASECFFQTIRKSARLHVSFEVLKGADKNIDVRIIDSTQTLIGNFLWTNEGNFEHNVTVPGMYQFCVDNSLSRFSSKLVYLFLLAYNEQDWNKYVANFQEFHGGVENVSKSLEKFDQHMNAVLVFQATARRHLMADWYIVRTNNTYVQRLSIAMCVIIFLTSVFQVVFVRRLFKAPTNVKPRA